MKFSILSGAYINAGDFLIVDRTIKLLKYIYPNCVIKEYIRKEKLDNYLEEINQSDALIIAGGPAYIATMYPNCIPLVENLNKIKTKIVTIGVGWYGVNTTDEFIYKYKFTSKTKELLNRITKDSNNLSCRDYYTSKSLHANGFNRTIMTGCPAWYNLDFVDKLELRKSIDKTFKKICISDPATRENFDQAYEVALYLQKKYPNSEINFIFHRIDPNNNIYEELWKRIKKAGINCYNITGSVDGFKIYDDCDIHIGYRVHAHIYNLSNRNISILIEEDGRGAGVNETLGLESLKAYIPTNNSTYDMNIWSKGIRFLEHKILKKGIYKCNNYVIKNLDNYINNIVNNNFLQYKTVYFNMNMYFYQMKKHIESIIEKDV